MRGIVSDSCPERRRALPTSSPPAARKACASGGERISWIRVLRGSSRTSGTPNDRDWTTLMRRAAGRVQAVPRSRLRRRWRKVTLSAGPPRSESSTSLIPCHRFRYRVSKVLTERVQAGTLTAMRSSTGSVSTARMASHAPAQEPTRVTCWKVARP